MRKKLNQWETFQALIRNPAYLEKYKDFSKLQIFDDIEYFQKREELLKLLKQWGFNQAIDPIDGKNKTQKEIIPFIDNPSVRIEPFKKDSNSIQLLENNRYLRLRIDLTNSRDKIVEDIKLILADFQSIIPNINKRETQERKINRFLVWDECLIEHNFRRVAAKLGTKEDTVRKAYYRAFEDIWGEKFDPQKHSKKTLTKEQLSKTCDTCPENPNNGGNCDTLCPEVLAFVNQDSKSMSSVRDPSKIDEPALSETQPDREINKKELLMQIQKITCKRFDSFEDAIMNLTERDKTLLLSHSEFSKYNPPR